MAKAAAKKPSNSGKANPISGTLQSVTGMPSKLKIFMTEASPYWWVRVFVNGRYRMKSLKTTSVKEAKEEAKKFFVDVHMTDQLGTTKPKLMTIPDGFVAVGNAYVETLNMSGHKRRYQDDRQRFLKEIAPFFATKRVQEITSADIGLFIKKLVNDGRSSATVVHYTGVLRKILKYAVDNRLLTSTPNIPRIPGRSSAKPRDYFSLEEYKALVKAAEDIAEDRVVVRGYEVTLELKYLVQFMVNSFIRPSDLRVLRHKHVKIKTRPDAERPDERFYLELSHPATKTTDKEVVTMPAAYGVYRSLVKLQEQRGYGKDEDFVFFPKYKNRNTMMVYAGKIFQELVRRANIDTAGCDKHTLYSLRHTAIMFRLMLGETDSLTLAKNARTSQAMIDKFYSSRLSPTQVVDVIHSFRRREEL